MMRIGLVHAVAPAIAPIHAAFARLWPQARTEDVTDLELPAELESAGSLTPGIHARILQLAQAAAKGADAVLFTCTAFDAAIDAARLNVAVPLWKPNEAMFDEALDRGSRIGFIATFQPAVAAMEAGLRARAAARGMAVDVTTVCVPDALAAARAGDHARHNALVAAAVPRLGDREVVLLAQFSTSTALDAAQGMTLQPVLSAPEAAVRALRRQLEGSDLIGN